MLLSYYIGAEELQRGRRQKIIADALCSIIQPLPVIDEGEEREMQTKLLE